MHKFSLLNLKAKTLLMAALLIVILSSCEKEVDIIKSQNNYNISLSRTNDLSAEEISSVDILLFNKQQTVTEVFNNVIPTNNLYSLSFDKNEISDLLVVANNDLMDLQKSNTLNKSLNELAQLQTAPVDFVNDFPSMFYTAKVETAGIVNSTIDVALLRSLSRLDLKIVTDIEVVVDSCIVSNLIDRSVLLPGSPLTPSLEQLKTARIKDGLTINMSNKSQEGLVYMYESKGIKPSVELYVKIQGVKTKLMTELPSAIERNKKYTVEINARGATVFTSLSILDWEEGDTTEAVPSPFGPLVDLVNSNLPPYVRVSEGRDTIYLPSCHTSFQLAIDAGTETEIMVEDPSINIKPITSYAANTYLGSIFNIEASQLDIISPKIVTRVYIKEKLANQFYDHHITIVREPSRLKFKGLNAIVHADSIRYSGYKDGNIASFTTAYAFKDVVCQSVDDQFNWIRITENEQSEYLIEGGFKPNDKEARGQSQKSKVSFSFEDDVTEVYYFIRKRTSLPVVYMGGRYWSKYSMRGNSKEVNDQVGFEDDVDDLWNFYNTCSDSELLKYVGSGYKGISNKGLTLFENEWGMVSYEGYNSIANAHLYTAPTDTHCPDGYLMPTFDEMGSFLRVRAVIYLPENNGIATTNYTATGGNNFSIKRIIREPIQFATSSTGNIYLMEIVEEQTGNKLHLIDVGHQLSASTSSASNISWEHMVLGSTNTLGQYYSFLNYTGRAGDQTHNTAKTKTIRCIKTDVQYIIE